MWHDWIEGMTTFKKTPYYIRQMKRSETDTKRISKIWFHILALFKSRYIRLSPNVLMQYNYKPKK